MIRIFKLLGLLKSVFKIIDKCKGALNTNGCSAAKRSLTERLNKIKAKSKKAKSKKNSCSTHNDEQRD